MQIIWILKSEAKLLTEEGNLISKIKGITKENYIIEEFVYKIKNYLILILNLFYNNNNKEYLKLYVFILFFNFLFQFIRTFFKHISHISYLISIKSRKIYFF